METNNDLEIRREKALNDIRRIVGNKKLMFSDAYRKDHNTVLGEGCMVYFGVSKNYAFIPCRALWGVIDGETGLRLLKYSMFKDYAGEKVKRVMLDDMFTKDLEKLYNGIVAYLEWEAERLPKLKQELDWCERCSRLLERV